MIHYGGSFDPFHLGHLGVIEGALLEIPGHEVCVVPTGFPYHKKAEASLEDRAMMARLACESMDKVVVRNIEPGDAPSYTIDTIEKLPKSKMAPIVLLGGDAVMGISGWKKWQELLGRVNVAVVPRMPKGDWMPKDSNAAALAKKGLVESADGLNKGTGHFFPLSCKVSDISSKGLQKMIKSGDPSWKKLVPSKVATYIMAQGLYGCL